ncbi:MAG: hypothetical protein C0506_06605 [Anaerolinea sp.]|nr:hypothetical protein [Anaerolinea sp.]
MRIDSGQRGRDGWVVTIEVPNAYTNGESRFERVTVPYGKLEGKTPDQVRQAIKDALDDDPLAAVLGEEVAAPTSTKEIYEDRAEATQARWAQWQWRIDHIADYPGYAALAAPQKTALLTALTNRRDAAAQADWAVLQQWMVEYRKRA